MVRILVQIWGLKSPRGFIALDKLKLKEKAIPSPPGAQTHPPRVHPPSPIFLLSQCG